MLLRVWDNLSLTGSFQQGTACDVRRYRYRGIYTDTGRLVRNTNSPKSCAPAALCECSIGDACFKISNNKRIALNFPKETSTTLPYLYQPYCCPAKRRRQANFSGTRAIEMFALETSLIWRHAHMMSSSRDRIAWLFKQVDKRTEG